MLEAVPTRGHAGPHGKRATDVGSIIADFHAYNFFSHNAKHEVPGIVSSTTKFTLTQNTHTEFNKEYGDPYPSTPYKTHRSNRFPSKPQLESASL